MLLLPIPTAPRDQLPGLMVLDTLAVPRDLPGSPASVALLWQLNMLGDTVGMVQRAGGAYGGGNPRKHWSGWWPFFFFSEFFGFIFQREGSMEVSKMPHRNFGVLPPSMCGCIPSPPWGRSHVPGNVLTSSTYSTCKHSISGKHTELLNMPPVIIMEL